MSTEGTELPEAATAPSVEAQATEARPIDGLPEWAQRELSQARTDAARYRSQLSAAREETQTLSERLAETEAARAADQIEAICARHGMSAEDRADLIPDGVAPEQAERIATRWAGRALGGATAKVGTGTALPTDPTRQFARTLFASLSEG